jgi:glutamyl-tRNA reductase
MLTIRNLKVAHRARFAQEQPEFDPRQVFSLNTCQRSLWVYWSNAENYDDSHAGTLPHFPGIDHFSGEQAYEFLLAVACGLESRILGETNIFGQLKEAWERFSSERDPHADPALTHLFHKLFEDTKDIRSQYLRHAGGDSYGSLVRRFMKEHSAAAGPILLLGAGDIARTVAPGLLENELWILNRDRSRTAGADPYPR